MIPSVKHIRPNFVVVTTETAELFFSYETLVAFRFANDPCPSLVICENVWGPTTGKHLNWIDNGTPIAKKFRLSRDKFEATYREALQWKEPKNLNLYKKAVA